MNFLLKNFLVLVFVMFLLVALGQWNLPKFQEQAYVQARESIMLDFTAGGGKNGEFIEPFDISPELFHAGVVTPDGTKFLYEVSITNPVLVQLTALNMFVAPKVRVTEIKTSEP
jgi:hypothetical protein